MIPPIRCPLAVAPLSDCAPASTIRREIEERKDVLVYTGEPLAEPTGNHRADFDEAVSRRHRRRDTDFMAKLVDVRPDGYAHNLAEGVVRARFRESRPKPTPITPGKVYEYAIDMWATSHVFKRAIGCGWKSPRAISRATIAIQTQEMICSSIASSKPLARRFTIRVPAHRTLYCR